VKRILTSRKYILNIVLASAAIGVIIFYAVCGGTCSYLKGHIFGLDLKYAGIIFMVFIILLSAMKKGLPLLILLSAGIGVEAYLVAFQVRTGVYCPFCLAFGGMLILLFLFNMDFRRKWVMASFIVLGYLLFLLFFKGSLIPTFSLT
jgi:hypothetical protein